MDLYLITGLLIFHSYVRGYPQNDSSLEVNNSHSRQVPPSFTTADFLDTSVPTFKEVDKTEVESQPRSSGIPWNRNELVRTTTPEESSESILISNLSKLTEKVKKSRENHDGYEESFERKSPEVSQPPVRREVSNIRPQPEDISDDSFPWNYYLYYPHDAKYLQTDHLDYPNLEEDRADQKNGTLSSSRVVQELGSRPEPQYYQKNYYYNYYPMVNRRSSASAKWKNDERTYVEDPNKRWRGTNTKKLANQNSCKQYLEFLRYAFEKLDEHPDYSYDYIEEEQWRDKLGQGNQHVFTTQMMGPTLYVDNSGNIAQMNSKENNIQSFDVYSAVPKAPHNPSTDFRQSTPIKPPSSSSAHPSHQYSHGISHSTSETPSSTLRKENFVSHYEPTTENWGKSNVQIINNGPSSRTDFIHETVTPIYITNPRPEGTQKYPSEKFEEDYKYNHPELRTTTPGATYWPSSENYYNTVGNYGERTTEHTPITNYVVNNESHGVGSPFNLIIQSTPQSPTRIPVPYSTEIEGHFNFDDTTTKKKDTDCDDKTLPCPDTVNITYPLNGYCNRYVSCEAGRATRRTCPEGLHFNIITKSCDLPHNSFCTYVCPKPNGYFGIPGDCGGYFVCKNSIPEYRMCPPHMHWNIKKQSCSFLEFSSCPMKCTSTNEVKYYEGDCKAYVICLSGIPYYHKCPPNTKFDKTSLTCVPDSLSQCEDDPRLLTKTVNPNIVCRDIELKVGNKTWCSFFEANKQRHYIP